MICVIIWGGRAIGAIVQSGQLSFPLSLKDGQCLQYENSISQIVVIAERNAKFLLIWFDLLFFHHKLNGVANVRFAILLFDPTLNHIFFSYVTKF